MFTSLTNSFSEFNLWTVIGFSGQIIFFSRFVVQWIYSEKHKKSIVPLQFWYLSIIGASLVFIYALHRKDPVFFLGQGVALLIYMRNISLHKQHKNEDSTPEDE